jgi:hypothetical protein
MVFLLFSPSVERVSSIASWMVVSKLGFCFCCWIVYVFCVVMWSPFWCSFVLLLVCYTRLHLTSQDLIYDLL